MAKKKILIVDDEQSITRLLKFALEKTGIYEILCENEGARAITSIRVANPNLLILDVNMPGTNGVEIAALVKADPSLQSTPILFLTGSVSDEEAENGMTISGFPAVGKPINMERLLQLIAKSLS